MRRRRSSALVLSAMLSAAPAMAEPQTVVIYASGGLHDGSTSWFEAQFKAFTDETGIRVEYVEAGAGAIVDRAARDRTRVDVLVTLPPFVQKAEADDLLQPFTPAAATWIRGGDTFCQPLANNYLSFIYNTASLAEPPASYAALLAPALKGRIQYSTPGEAGDGTAVMLQAFHVFGGKEAGFAYLEKLQANNVGPSPATKRLTALVNGSTLQVANGDLQMNLTQLPDNPHIGIFWPAGPGGTRSALSMPYSICLMAEAPHAEQGKALIDHLLSRKAQAAVSGEPVRTDVPPTGPSHNLFRDALKGVEIWSPDWNQVLKELPVDIARWHRVTGS